jgi:5'-nucleotidase
MAIRQVMDVKPDLVLSGVNSGSNVADDVTYSGTIAGAIEGTLQGVRSFALSQAYLYENGSRVVPWDVAETHAPALLNKLMTVDLPDGTFLNLNFPNCRPEEVDGAEVTAQGNLAFNVQVEERADGRGFPYYWLRFGERNGIFRPGTDIQALKQNRISVTPLKLDLTDYSAQDRVARALGME